jgi:hypothetical protein
LRSDLFILELGSFAVLALVSFFFIPDILEQNDFLLFADLEPGLSLEGLVVTAFLSFEPGFAALYDAIPLAFKPPDFDLPSERVQAGVEPPFLKEDPSFLIKGPLGTLVILAIISFS